jgi:hypothetical protein
MPRVIFAPPLNRFAQVPEVLSHSRSLRDALDDALAANPNLAGQVLDEQRRLRPNVVVFVDERRCDDRNTLARPLAAGSTVRVLQALSGG